MSSGSSTSLILGLAKAPYGRNIIYWLLPTMCALKCLCTEISLKLVNTLILLFSILIFGFIVFRVFIIPCTASAPPPSPSRQAPAAPEYFLKILNLPPLI